MNEDTLELTDERGIPVCPPIPVRLAEDGSNAEEIVIGPFPETGFVSFDLQPRDA